MSSLVEQDSHSKLLFLYRMDAFLRPSNLIPLFESNHVPLPEARINSSTPPG